MASEALGVEDEQVLQVLAEDLPEAVDLKPKKKRKIAEAKKARKKTLYNKSYKNNECSTD
jgi:O-phosphoseryl-tRNA(Cys) synthetase